MKKTRGRKSRATVPLSAIRYITTSGLIQRWGVYRISGTKLQKTYMTINKYVLSSQLNIPDPLVSLLKCLTSAYSCLKNRILFVNLILYAVYVFVCQLNCLPPTSSREPRDHKLSCVAPTRVLTLNYTYLLWRDVGDPMFIDWIVCYWIILLRRKLVETSCLFFINMFVNWTVCWIRFADPHVRKLNCLPLILLDDPNVRKQNCFATELILLAHALVIWLVCW